MLRVNPSSWLFGALALGLFACAQGTSLTDSGSSGPTTGSGATGATSGAGGSGGGDTTTATTTATTSTTTSATTGGGGAPPTCDEDPCKLVSPQCGCPDGQQCSVGANGRFCTGEGAVAWGDECGVAGACEPGTLCVLTKQTSPTVSTCSKFCADDSDCQAPGGLCLLTLNDGNGGTVPNATLCTQNCDPISNAGCNAPNTACAVGQEQTGLMRIFSICGGAGAGTQNTTCVAANDNCAPGYGCFDVGQASDVCLKWCNVNSPVCSGGTSCVALNINGQNVQIGAVQYGACL